MATYAGWEGVLQIEGSQTREVLTESSAGGSNVVYYTAHWPIVDGTGTVTDTPSDITVYDNGTPMASDGSAYTLDGSEGAITIISATAGHQYDVTYNSKETVGYWKDIEFTWRNNLKVVHVGGQRGPYDVKETTIEIPLKFGEVYIDSRALRMATGGADRKALPSFSVTIQTKSTGGDEYVITGVKMNSAKLGLKHDDITGVDVDAIGTAITIGTT